MFSGQSWASVLVRFRHPLWILGLFLVAVCTAGGQHLVFENDYKIFFNGDDPRLVAHEAMEDAYTKSDSIAFLIGVDEGDLFTPRRLQAIDDLTQQLWGFQRVIRVDSISNFQHTEAADDDLLVYPLFENPSSMDAAEIERRKAIVLAESTLVGARIAEDGRATLINARIEMPTGSSLERGEATASVMAEARAIRDAFVATYPDIEMHLMGVPAIDQAFNDSTVKDMNTLVPAMFLVMIFVCALLLRSVIATLAVVLVIVTTLPATMGTVGWLGFALNQINVSSPIIIMTLCVCDAIHVLVSHRQLQRQGMSVEDARLKALDINMQPIFLTSLTTAIGFLCLNFSDSPPFRDLGTFVAIGVMFAWVLSLLFLPALMGLIRVPANSKEQTTFASRLGDWVLDQRKPLYWGGLIVAVVAMAFAPRNELSDSTYQYFDPGVPIRDAADFLENRLTGFDTIAFSLPAAEANGITHPQYLANLEAFAAWSRQQPNVKHVTSFSDVMKRLNRDMHGGDVDWYKVPESAELAAQYLLLYELSLPFGLDLANQLNFDKSATRFLVTLHHVKAKRIVEFEEQARAWLDANTPQMSAPGSGVTVMFAHIGQNNIYSMLTGSLIALISISFTLMLALRSWRLGVLSLIPNGFPSLIAFGLWGLFVQEVNLAVAAIFSISLGIVVDDTVHFLSKYLRARQTAGSSAEDAVRYAFSTVGNALLVTTIILVLGFSILGLSEFQVNSITGILTAITISIALIYDLLFLPTLLLRLDGWLKLGANDKAAAAK
ncbi:MAG: efflux RND transporter permease subunit [Oceanococcus sp.]